MDARGLSIAIEAIGWIGAGLILAAYVLTSTGRLSGQSAAFQWLNVAGAAGFVVNSGWHGALPSTILNIVWMMIGVWALWRIGARPSST